MADVILPHNSPESNLITLCWLCVPGFLSLSALVSQKLYADSNDMAWYSKPNHGIYSIDYDVKYRMGTWHWERQESVNGPRQPSPFLAHFTPYFPLTWCLFASDKGGFSGEVGAVTRLLEMASNVWIFSMKQRHSCHTVPQLLERGGCGTKLITWQKKSLQITCFIHCNKKRDASSFYFIFIFWLMGCVVSDVTM